MKKYLASILLLTLLFGCRTSNISRNAEVTSVDNSIMLAKMKYDPIENKYQLDMFDLYMDAIYAGKCVLSFPVWLAIYLVTNVEFFNSRPEEEFSIDNITVRIVIFRWRF